MTDDFAEACPMPSPLQAPQDDELRDLLHRTKTIAVVGASPKPHRVSYGVISWLLENSPYTFYLVNPTVATPETEGQAVKIPGSDQLALDGLPFYTSLEAIPHPIDM